MAGLASLPIVGKLFKPLKALKTAKTINLAPATGMPEWFPSLVNKVIKEGDDVTKKLGTVEREIVHTKKLDGLEDVTVYRNLDSGDVRVEYGNNFPHQTNLEYKAPKEIESGKYKGKKTDAEFAAAEAEPEVVNWDGDIEWSGLNEVDNVKDLTTDVSALKKYATGKNPTIKEMLDTSKKKTYRQQLEDDTMTQVDYIEKKGGYQSIEDVLDEGKRVGDFDPKGYDPTNEFRGINLPTKKAKGGRVSLSKGGLAKILGV